MSTDGRREYASVERRIGERRSGTDRRSNWRDATRRLYGRRSPAFDDLLTELAIWSASESLCAPHTDVVCEPCERLFDALWRAARESVS